jgi:hypothetical protein
LLVLLVLLVFLVMLLPIGALFFLPPSGRSRRWVGRYTALDAQSSWGPEHTFNEGFLVSLGQDLRLSASTLEALRNHQIREATLLSLTRSELEVRLNVTLNDAVAIYAWSTSKRKAEEDKERLERKAEEEKERLLKRQQKLDRSKCILIFNDANGRYEEFYFSDQNILQSYFSNLRIGGLALVREDADADADADAGANTQIIPVTIEWERLVNSSRYAVRR